MCTEAIIELRKSSGPGITIAGTVMTCVVATTVLCIAVGGVGAQRVAARLRLPAIVLLFGFGPLIGPVLQILHPAVAFGSGLQPMVGLAVAIVVFEGGLALDFRELCTAVVLPLLRNIRLQARTSSFFKREAIVNDPIGALMAR